MGVTSPFELQFRGVGRREGCRAGQLCAGSCLEYFSASSNASAPTSAIHGQQRSTGHWAAKHDRASRALGWRNAVNSSTRPATRARHHVSQRRAQSLCLCLCLTGTHREGHHTASCRPSFYPRVAAHSAAARNRNRYRNVLAVQLAERQLPNRRRIRCSRGGLQVREGRVCRRECPAMHACIRSRWAEEGGRLQAVRPII